jgi:gamma-glutamyltranspeptidase / glutathione hydrolase
VAAWIDSVALFGSGKLGLSDVLQPAITLAQDGFVVQPVCAQQWAAGAVGLRLSAGIAANGKGSGADKSCAMLRYDTETGLWSPPRAGEVFTNPDLARTLRGIADQGRSGFYAGRVAKELVSAVRAHGGVLSLEDLSAHASTPVDPIHVNYRGVVDVWEIPPRYARERGLWVFCFCACGSVRAWGLLDC